MARLDLMYAHIEDPVVPLAETVEGFAELVASGLVGPLGVSNHWPWRVERARALACAAGLPGVGGAPVAGWTGSRVRIHWPGGTGRGAGCS